MHRGRCRPGLSMNQIIPAFIVPEPGLLGQKDDHRPYFESVWRCSEEFCGRNWRVDNVNTLGFGSRSRGCGSARIPHVFGSSLYLQGLECGSSPTSGTHYPSSEGFLLLMCVH